MHIIMCVFQLYESASGQEINFQKYGVTCSKRLELMMKYLIGLWCAIETEERADKYLGLPECFIGSKRELLSFINDKIMARLNGWYVKNISLGGKEVLLKYVAMALLVYDMTFFPLSRNQCKQR